MARVRIARPEIARPEVDERAVLRLYLDRVPAVASGLLHISR